MKMLGATHLVSVSAVGSMQGGTSRPGDLVVVDQFIDLTKRRVSTFFDEGIVAHVCFADPVCQTCATALADGRASAPAAKVHHGAARTSASRGPQFSTRAESHLYRSWGVSVIGMTAMPEAKLAREAELPYRAAGARDRLRLLARERHKHFHFYSHHNIYSHINIHSNFNDNHYVNGHNDNYIYCNFHSYASPDLDLHSHAHYDRNRNSV